MAPHSPGLHLHHCDHRCGCAMKVLRHLGALGAGRRGDTAATDLPQVDEHDEAEQAGGDHDVHGELLANVHHVSDGADPEGVERVLCQALLLDHALEERRLDAGVRDAVADVPDEQVCQQLRPLQEGARAPVTEVVR